MTTREKLIETTSKLIHQKGYHGTGINEILEEVGIPKGSLYHHFPGGKDELVAAALYHFKDHLSILFKNSLKGKTSVENGLVAILDQYITMLNNSNFTRGCPVSIVAMETAGNNELLNEACRALVDFWIDGLAAYFQYKGYNAGRKEAEEFITRMEGALLMARIYSSDKPIRKLKNQIKEILNNESK